MHERNMNIKNKLHEYIYSSDLEMPYEKKVDLSQLKLKDFVPVIKEVLGQKKESVTNDMVSYYVLKNAIDLKKDTFYSKEDLSIHQEYVEETDRISQKLFVYQLLSTLSETINARDFYTLRQKNNEHLYENNHNYDPYTGDLIPSKSKAQAKKDSLARAALYKKSKIEDNYRYKNEDSTLTLEKFSLVYDLLEKVSNAHDSEGRKLITCLEEGLFNKKFENLTLKDIFQANHIMFKVDNFSYNNGGIEWQNMMDSTLHFINGHTSANKLVESIFNFENKRGQQFRKEIVYIENNVEEYQYICLDDPDYSRRVYLQDSKICLNAIKNNQLWEMVSFPYKEVDYLPSFNEMDDKRKKELEELTGDEVTNFALSKTIETTQHNLKQYKNIFGAFQEKRPQLFKKLLSLNNPVPLIDYQTLYKKIRDDDGDRIVWPQKSQSYFQLASYLTNEAALPYRDNKQTINGLKQDDIDLENDEKTQTIEKVYAITPKDAKSINSDLLGEKGLGLLHISQMQEDISQTIILPKDNALLYEKNKAVWLKGLKSILNGFRKEDNETLLGLVSNGNNKNVIGNIGIDSSNYENLCKEVGQEIVNKHITKFMKDFCMVSFDEKVVFSTNLPKALFQFRSILSKHGVAQDYDDMFPINSRQQYHLSIEKLSGLKMLPVKPDKRTRNEIEDDRLLEILNDPENDDLLGPRNTTTESNNFDMIAVNKEAPHKHGAQPVIIQKIELPVLENAIMGKIHTRNNENGIKGIVGNIMEKDTSIKLNIDSLSPLLKDKLTKVAN
jgi:hypothetical protein